MIIMTQEVVELQAKLMNLVEQYRKKRPEECIRFTLYLTGRDPGFSLTVTAYVSIPESKKYAAGVSMNHKLVLKNISLEQMLQNFEKFISEEGI